VVLGKGEEPAQAAALLADHVGDDGLALHVDAGRAPADHVDTLDLAGGDAAKHLLDVVGLAGGALPVDQGVARGALETAHRRAGVQAEPGHAVDHVGGVGGLLRGEIGRRIADDALGGRSSGFRRGGRDGLRQDIDGKHVLSPWRRR
jgi:hypothetical protein